MSAPLYSERVGVALKLAADAFRHRQRKGTGAPYLTHLLAVASIVMDYGGNEDQIVAAVLHDLLEDIPAPALLRELCGNHGLGNATHELQMRRVITTLDVLFGTQAVAIIQAMSDSTNPGQKEPWHERKRRYVAGLRSEPTIVKLVAAADKMHNMRSIVRDYETPGIGAKVFDRFGKTTIDDHHWYYNAVCDAISYAFPHPITVELHDARRKLMTVLEAQPSFTRATLRPA